MGFIIRIFRVNYQTKEADRDRETKARLAFSYSTRSIIFYYWRDTTANTTDQQRRRRLFPNFTTSVHLILLLRAYYATPSSPHVQGSSGRTSAACFLPPSAARSGFHLLSYFIIPVVAPLGHGASRCSSRLRSTQ